MRSLQIPVKVNANRSHNGSSSTPYDHQYYYEVHCNGMELHGVTECDRKQRLTIYAGTTAIYAWVHRVCELYVAVRANLIDNSYDRTAGS